MSTTDQHRLSPRWRKAFLTAHLITAVGLLGVDLTVLALGLAGLRGADPVTVYPAADLLARWLLLPLALLSLVTGLVLGLRTPWGLFRYWWVSIKFVFNTVGVVLAAVVLLPLVHSAAGAATAGSTVLSADQGGVLRSASGATTVLTLSVLLAVYKPFGRLRRGATRRVSTPRRARS